MSKTTTGRLNREIFGERFSRLYEEGKSKGRWKTQTEFGKLFSPHASRGSVMKWCSGDNIPSPERLKRICEIFGVDEQYFDTDNATRAELLVHSSDFITRIGKDNASFAQSKGLSLELVDALAGIVDFDKLFPVYLPIPDREDSIMPGKRGNAKSPQIDDDYSYLQIERGEKRITLHRCDLMFLKEVQDQIISFVEFMFYHRAKEMKNEAIQFNNEFLRLHPKMEKPDGYKSVLEFQIAWDKENEEKEGDCKPLILEVREICKQFDRFMWCFEEKSKGRKATQKDMDRFFSEGGRTFTKDGVTYTEGR